jgi:hypothetical protein
MPRKPPPVGAWSLIFLDGALAGQTDRWNLTCPADWADSGERYVLESKDEANRVATMRLVTAEN